MNTYHSSHGISKSGLDLIHKNPFEFKHYIIDKNERSSTPQMEFGTRVHEAILEPDSFKIKYVPDTEFLALGSRLTKKYKAAKEDFENANTDITIIKEEEYDNIAKVADAVQNHSLAGDLLRDGEAERILRWNHAGIECKCRVDLIRDRDELVVDLKTTTDASKFESSVAAFRYHVQAAWYCWGVYQCLKRDVRMLFVVVERDEPYGIRVCSLNDESVKCGTREVFEDLELYKRCMDEGHFPNYEEMIEVISLPKWRLNE